MGDQTTKVAIRAAVRGEVQGVGFRDATRQPGARAGRDGLGAQRRGRHGGGSRGGRRDAVDELVAFLQEGPPSRG